MSQGVYVSISGKNEIHREGLRLILTKQQFDVQSVVSDASALTDADGSRDNHVIIVDSLRETNESEVCRTLRSRFPKARIILMSENCSVASVVNAFDLGVDGFLEKTISCEPLGHAIKLVALGHKVLPTTVVNVLTHQHWKSKDNELGAADASVNLSVSLSDREFDILRCLARGDTNKVIGRRLDITEATVKVHLKGILRKLGLDNRTQAAIWAVNHKVVSTPQSRMLPDSRISAKSSLEHTAI